MPTRFRLSIAFAILLWCDALARAMQFAQEQANTTEMFLIGRGPVIAGDAARLERALGSLQPGTRLLALALDSPGGLVTEGEALARVIRSRAVPVVVPADRQCVSICFLMFAAAPRRFADANALVGVHSANENGVENDATMAVSVQMARIAASFGVPAAIIGKMVQTRGQSVAWLTPEDMTLMGVKVYNGDILAATRTQGTVGMAPAITTAIPIPLPFAPVPTARSVNFLAGRNDRADWDTWFKVQPAAFRDGAIVALLQAGLPASGACRGVNGGDRGDFSRGCDAAMGRLVPVEPRMRNDPEYAAGWNSLGIPPWSEHADEAEYRGVYFCGRQSAALTVRLFPPTSAPGRRALFSFGPQPTSPDVPRGAFIAEGQVDPSVGQLVLKPVKWLIRPGSYAWFGLTGLSRENGEIFSGRVTDADGCSQFTLKRNLAGR